EVFPNLIVETEFIAKGADVGIIDYYFMNNREVYDPAEYGDKKNSVNQDHCTVVAGFNLGKLVIGHNEDWSLDALGDLYILKAKIGETAFIGLNYATGVCGLSASMNNYGLVQCVNDIYQTNKIGVPKNYLARAILEIKTLDEAENLIKKTPRGSGFNHVLAQGSEIRNIEIAGEHLGVQKSINNPYVHTNHYLVPELQRFEKFHTKSSEARYLRAKQLISDNMSIQDIVRILSDTANVDYPICRADETIGSAVFTPSELKASFCYGHPCAGEFMEYKI
ncbi:hypothetical protein COT50_00905, partial [candidate division WWE3 bacterium CG08_land_8_20_14_0_20_41_10]